MPSGKRMPQPRRDWRLGGRSWRQLVELRTQFSTELERARAGEHRPGTRRSQRAARAALHQEPTARQKSERAAEDLRTELAQSRSEARDAGRSARGRRAGAAPGRAGRSRSGAGAPATGGIARGAARADGRAAEGRWPRADRE